MAKRFLVIVETIREDKKPMTMYILFFLAYLLATAQIDKAH